MKKIILITLITLFTMATFAGEKDYMADMEKNIKELYQAKTASDYQGLANNFERIAEAAPEEWLPLYYVSYSYLNMVFSEGNESDIDMVLDKAEAYLNKARELSPENDEVEVLQGWIYQGRIQVDPMGRGVARRPRTRSKRSCCSFCPIPTSPPSTGSSASTTTRCRVAPWSGRSPVLPVAARPTRR